MWLSAYVLKAVFILQGFTPGSVTKSVSSSVSWFKSADDTLRDTKFMCNIRLPTIKTKGRLWPSCTARPLRDIVSSWPFKVDTTLKSFFLDFWGVLTPVSKGHCTQWDHYMKNTKWSVPINPTQLPLYPENLWIKTNTVYKTCTEYFTISLTFCE